MNPEPQDEHRWLQKLVGDWTVTMSAECGAAGEAPQDVSWSETVRALNDLWIVGEGSGAMPDGTPVTTIITLGYDPRVKAFVGTWIGTMMTHMWVYRGSLDDSGKVLTLDCEGPDFENPERTLRYQDVITILDDDRRTLTGRVQGADGEWKVMMVAHYTRTRAAAAAVA
ncbi:DUF1579 domain-containing protein [Lutibaculum baratangense]|nr:DUF1579 domain-containing protein [Lutibaculum baratangense]